MIVKIEIFIETHVVLLCVCVCVRLARSTCLLLCHSDSIPEGTLPYCKREKSDHKSLSPETGAPMAFGMRFFMSTSKQLLSD
jgi:hypothetical protein